jgi:hypothetical protein
MIGAALLSAVGIFVFAGAAMSSPAAQEAEPPRQLVAARALRADVLALRPLSVDDVFFLVRLDATTRALGAKHEPLVARLLADGGASDPPIQGDDDAARTFARMQRIERTFAAVVLELRTGRTIVPKDALADDALEELLAEARALPPTDAAIVRLAVARRRLAGGGSIDAIREEALRAEGVPDLVRLAFAALPLLVADAAADADADAILRGLRASVERSAWNARLFAADVAVARSIAADGSVDPTAWIVLHDIQTATTPRRGGDELADRRALAELRRALVDRLRDRPLRIPPDRAMVPAALLATIAPDTGPDDAITRMESLDRLAAARPDDPALPVALFEAGRAAVFADRPVKAAECFERVAERHPQDPLSDDAIEFAVAMRTDAVERGLADRSTLLRTLDLAITRFPRHPQQAAWRFERAATTLRDPASRPDERGEARALLRGIAAGDPRAFSAALLVAWSLSAESSIHAAAADERPFDDAMNVLEERARRGVPKDDADALALLRIERSIRSGAVEDAEQASTALLAGADDPAIRARALALACEARYRRASSPFEWPLEAERVLREGRDAAWGDLRAFLDARLVFAEVDERSRAVARSFGQPLLESVGRAAPPSDRLALGASLLRNDALPAAAILLSTLERDGAAGRMERTDALLLLGEIGLRGSDAASVARAAAAFDEAIRGADDGSDRWWRGQLGRLRAVLRSGSPDERNAGLVAINRLRLRDPNFGGVGLDAEFERLAEQFAAASR